MTNYAGKSSELIGKNSDEIESLTLKSKLIYSIKVY